MSATLLDRMLEPLTEDVDVPLARKLAALQADPELQARVDFLADKANEGTLSDAERSEYDRYLVAWHVLTLLQLKARKFLKDAS